MDYIKTLETAFKGVMTERIPDAKNIEIRGEACAEGYGCFEIKTFKPEHWRAMKALNIQDFAICNSAEDDECILVEFMIAKTYDSSTSRKIHEVIEGTPRESMSDLSLFTKKGETEK